MLLPNSEPAGFCPNCGYRINTGVCPECGMNIAQCAMRDPTSKRSRTLRWIRRIAIATTAIVVLAAAPVYYAARRYLPVTTLYRMKFRGGWLGSRASEVLHERHAQDQATINAKFTKIEAELASLETHGWAGCYANANNDFDDIHLCIAPNNDYAIFERSRDEWFDRLEYGRVEASSPEQIRLVPEYISDLAISAAPRVFCRITWGDRHYLADPAYMSIACMGIPIARETAMLGRKADLNKRIYGLPAVASEFQPLLPKTTKMGRVTWVGPTEVQHKLSLFGTKYDDYQIKVRLDLGRRDELDELSNLLPWVPYARERWQLIEIDHVGEGDSLANFTCSVDRGIEPLLPKVGWPVTYFPNDDIPKGVSSRTKRKRRRIATSQSMIQIPASASAPEK